MMRKILLIAFVLPHISSLCLAEDTLFIQCKAGIVRACKEIAGACLQEDGYACATLALVSGTDGNYREMTLFGHLGCLYGDNKSCEVRDIGLFKLEELQRAVIMSGSAPAIEDMRKILNEVKAKVSLKSPENFIEAALGIKATKQTKRKSSRNKKK